MAVITLASLEGGTVDVTLEYNDTNKVIERISCDNRSDALPRLTVIRPNGEMLDQVTFLPRRLLDRNLARFGIKMAQDEDGAWGPPFEIHIAS